MNWQVEGGGQVRTPRESESVRGTHELESGKGGTSQETKRKRENEEHSPAVERRWRDKSGH